ncbi:MAG: 16S rRNA (adenine(1518)-N(6)/adenine(1519)-N(6))-dimethyltransferase RsmA [Actinomycetia bacterium]|nr:16S rRNA (adenine(1518)-N(6)/adenine(1519)-N(6))-dimethyltransferase RsmA [Actinomycetes bacterium]
MLGATEVRRLLDEHGLSARKSLGQNFVTDPGTLRRIVSIAGIGPGSPVLEVGPGIGCLTLALAEAGASVTAVEKDPTLLPVLDEVLATLPVSQRPNIVRGDALELDWQDLLQGDGWFVVANLPYNVAVPIILGLLTSAPMVDAMWVMVQLEMAERICAQPGGRTIGVPTIKVGWYADASIAMTVSPEVFTPRPRVRSAVVELRRRRPPDDSLEPAVVFDLVDTAYRQRRKMLRSSLATLVGGDGAGEVWAGAGIDPTSRPEQLSVTDWSRLASSLLRCQRSSPRRN